MDNFDIKLDLLKFRNSALIDLQRNGAPVKCIVIPVEENSIFIGKGNKSAYAGFRASTMRTNDQYGNTHYIKLSLSKQAYMALNDDEKKNQPFFGSMKPIGSYTNNGGNSGQGNPKQSPQQNNYNNSASSTNADDLPF